MSFSGGVYTLPGPALNTGEIVSASENNTFRNDVATAFNLTFLRNGTSTATANLPMGGYKLTGLGVATTSGDALSYGQAATVSTLTATGAAALNGGITVDSTAFTVADATGNTSIAGTLAVTGVTTLTADPVLSGGTANGVAYLNGSKVLTTGSALVFDGTNLGIGTSSPSSYGKFVTKASDSTNILNVSGTTYGLRVGTNSSSSTIQGVDTSTTGSYQPLEIAAGGYVAFSTGSAGGGSFSERMRLDSSGNLGLGVTPSAANLPTIQSSYGLFTGNNQTNICANAYYNSGWKYVQTGVQATKYSQLTAGAHVWEVAGAGTAGNAITFTQAMTLDANGYFQVGTTTNYSIYTKASILHGVALAYDSSNGGVVVGATTGGTELAYLSMGRNYNLAYAGQVALATSGAQPILFGTSNTERMRIDSSGNVGIGTSTQNERLRLNSSTAGEARLTIAYGGTAMTYLGSYSGITGSGNATDTFLAATGALMFGAGSTVERMRIDSSGALLIGTTSGLGGDGQVLAAKSTSTTAIRAYRATSSTGAAIQIWQSDVGGTAAEKYFVLANGTATSSDERLKENIEDVSGCLDKLLQVRVRNFTWKQQDGDEKDIGVIAQEIENVLPEMVWENPNVPEGAISYKAVRYDKLTPMLVKAIQELKAELDATKAEVAALKGN